MPDTRGQGGNDRKRAERRAGCSALAGLAGGWLGRLLVVRVGPSSWLGGLLLFFLFYFSFLFHLFEFKFGLKFDFTTEVTYSLEFREFCLIITLWFIILLELFSNHNSNGNSNHILNLTMYATLYLLEINKHRYLMTCHAYMLTEVRLNLMHLLGWVSIHGTHHHMGSLRKIL